MPTIRELIGVAVAALLLVALAGLVTHVTEPARPAAPVPACAAEDSPGPCFWNARTRGNHQGRSFTAPPGRN